MPIDEVLESFGKSAFNISQEAFNFHKSQHWTWFYGWLYGENRPVSAASQIRTYNPAKYGLFHTLVGVDTENDMLENVETHSARTARIAFEEEQRAKEAAALESMAKETLASVSTEQEVQLYNNEENISTKGNIMRYLIFPAIVVAIVVAIIVTIWIIEEKPFIRLDHEKDE